MLTDRAEGLMRISRLAKYLIVSAALPSLTLLAADHSTSAVSTRAALLLAMIVFLTLMAFGPSWFLWSKTWFRSPMRTAFKLAGVECVLIATTLLGAQSVIPDKNVLTSQTPVILMTSALLLVLLNRFVPDTIAIMLYRWQSPQRILTVGSEHAIGLIDHQLNKAARLGLIRVNHRPIKRSQEGIRLFNPDRIPKESLSLADVEDVVLNHDSSLAVDRVVFVEDPNRQSNPGIRNLLQQRCNSLGVPLTVYTDCPGLPFWNKRPLQVSEATTSRTPHSPLQNPINQFVKRCIDLLISVPVVIFLLPPLCVLVRLIHRKQSPGPLFYRQERHGRNGVAFRILKFRTMHAPTNGESDIETDPGPRIFRLGALLRDSRLDEIPQFINVLAGTMSIVGPRAHNAQDRAKFSAIVPHYPMRMQAKPGITGLAQYREYRGVFRRNSVEDRVECDLIYIAKWNIEADLVLMAKTATLIAEALALATIRTWGHSSQHGVEMPVPVDTSSFHPDRRAA